VDADELARIEETLLTAIAEAKAVVKERSVGPQFREIVRHAREMHDFLLAYCPPAGLRRLSASGD
jgi:hypothetical protein